LEIFFDALGDTKYRKFALEFLWSRSTATIDPKPPWKYSLWGRGQPEVWRKKLAIFSRELTMSEVKGACSDDCASDLDCTVLIQKV
jgi:hypothetical protein